jgi:hypothetical protein
MRVENTGLSLREKPLRRFKEAIVWFTGTPNGLTCPAPITVDFRTDLHKHSHQSSVMSKFWGAASSAKERSNPRLSHNAPRKCQSDARLRTHQDKALFQFELLFQLIGSEMVQVVLSVLPEASGAASVCVHLFNALLELSPSKGAVWKAVLQVIIPGSVAWWSRLKVHSHCPCAEMLDRGNPPEHVYYVSAELQTWINPKESAPGARPTLLSPTVLSLGNLSLVWPVRADRVILREERSSRSTPIISRYARAILLDRIIVLGATLAVNGASSPILTVADIFPSDQCVIVTSNTMIEIESGGLGEKKEETDVSASFPPETPTLVSSNELQRLNQLFVLVQEWQMSFPRSPFSPPSGVLLKGTSECRQ